MKLIITSFLLVFTAQLMALDEPYDKREVVAVNKLPVDFTLFITGDSDDVTNGTFGGGERLYFDISNKTRNFRLKNVYFITGGYGYVSDVNFGDYIDVSIVAPASSGMVEGSCSNVNKQEVIPSSGMNMIIPAVQGQGTHCISYIDAINQNVSILKVTPVPNDNNSGWYKYDYRTNAISPCSEAECEYDLYDFDIVLFNLARKMSVPTSGAFYFDASEIPAKMILPNWIIKMQFNTENILFKSCVNLITGVKSN